MPETSNEALSAVLPENPEPEKPETPVIAINTITDADRLVTIRQLEASAAAAESYMDSCKVRLKSAKDGFDEKVEELREYIRGTGKPVEAELPFNDATPALPKDEEDWQEDAEGPKPGPAIEEAVERMGI